MRGTEYITKYNEKRTFHKGICLDIFPFDAIPNSKKEQDRFREEIGKCYKKHKKILNKQAPAPDYPDPSRNLEEVWYRTFGFLHRWFYWHASLDKTQRIFDCTVTKYNATAEQEGLEYVGSFIPNYSYGKLTDILPYQKVMFEDILLKAPCHPDPLMTLQYGDYMKLPPRHKRLAHQLLRWGSTDAEGADELSEYAGEGAETT